MNSRPLPRRDILLFSVAKYVEFSLKFIHGILIAKFLGPYLFGIWGFLMLIQQYLLYTGLGFQDVVTVELSNKSKSDSTNDEKVIAEALGATIVIGILLVLVGLTLQNFPSTLFDKYQIERYILWLTVLASLTHVFRVLICAYRVYGYILLIAITQFLIAAIPLLPLIWFRGDKLIFAVLLSMVLVTALSVAILVLLAPFRVYARFSLKATRSLLLIGVPLLVYNFSFYLITISARTILSLFYSVQAMGYYTLASSITNALLLGFKSILFVILPSMIRNTSAEVADAEAKLAAHNASHLYSISVMFVSLITIICFPLLFQILPEYQPAQGTVSVLLLSQILLSATFGYNAAAISRGYHLSVARISLMSVLIVLLTGGSFAWFGFPFVWMAVSVFLGAVLFLVLQARLGMQLFETEDGTSRNIFEVFSVTNWCIVLCCLAISLLDLAYFLYIGLLAVFVVFNREKFMQIWALRSGHSQID